MSLKKDVIRGGVMGFCIAAIIVALNYAQLIYTVPMSLLEQMFGKSLQITAQYQWVIFVIFAIFAIIYGFIGGIGYWFAEKKWHSQTISIISSIVLILAVFSILLALRINIPLPGANQAIPTTTEVPAQ